MVGSNCGHTTMTNFSERSHSIIIISIFDLVLLIQHLNGRSYSGITKSTAQDSETEWGQILATTPLSLQL